MTKTVRYELRTDWTFIEKLERVSTAAGLTKEEAIRAGIDLLERLVEADKQGKEFALVSKINMAKNVTTETGLRQRIDFLTSSMRSEREERKREREERKQKRQQLLSSLRLLDDHPEDVVAAGGEFATTAEYALLELRGVVVDLCDAERWIAAERLEKVIDILGRHHALPTPEATNQEDCDRG
jgi:hypothetical protein